MAKETDQTQTTEEETQTTQTDAGEKTDDVKDSVSTAAAVKTSSEFDKKLDEEGYEEDDSKADSSKTGDDDAAGKGKQAKAEKAESPKGDDHSAEEQDADKEAGADKGETQTDSKISKEVATRAANLGLTTEEIAGFENDEDLTRTLNVLDGIIADTGDDGEQKTDSTATDKTAEGKTDDDGFKLTFKNEADIDPELLANIKGMQKHYADKVQKLEEKLEAVTGNIQQRQQTEFMSRFDGMIKSLGTDFADTFGDGPSEQLSSRTNAAKNRIAVRTRMYAFAKGLADAGEKIPDEQTLFDMAVNSLHGQKLKTIAGKQMHEKTSARAKGAIGRPAPRRTGDLSPIQKAVATSRKFDDLIDTSEA